MRTRRMRGRVVALAAAAALLAACGGDSTAGGDDGSPEGQDQTGDEDTDDDDGQDEGGEGRDAWPEVIYSGIQPSDDAEALAASYAPFEEYMSACLDHPFEGVLGTSPTALIEAMRTGELHTSFYGPFAYILAAERAGAEAMVQLAATPDDASYRSLIIALDDSGFSSLEDLEGTLFAFTDPASTSGYLFPRAMMLEELGLEDDEIDGWFGEVIYSGTHANSVLAVLNGDVEAAAVASNTSLFTSGLDPSHPREDDVVIVAETQDIPTSAETIRSDLPDDLKTAVKSCWLQMSQPESLAEFDGLAELLELRTGGDPGVVVEVDDSAYDIVRETGERLGLSPEDLLG